MIVIHTTRLTMNHVSIVLRSVTTTVNQLNIDVLDILCDPFYARDEICFFKAETVDSFQGLGSFSLLQIRLIRLYLSRRIILPLDRISFTKIFEHRLIYISLTFQ